MSPVLHLYTSATGAAQRLEKLVGPATRRGWDVFVIGTPQSEPFMDTAAIEKICGNQVSFHFRRPEESSTRQPADAAIFAGASFNTINKWALGVADNLALSLLCELTPHEIPVVLMPFVNQAMASHPALGTSYATLTDMGVKILTEPDNLPHPRNQGGRYLERYPWTQALDLVTQKP